MDKYKTYKLSDIASVQTGPFGSQLHQEDYVENGTPIITVEHLGENRIIHRNLPRVSDEDKERLAKYSLQTNDIVFSRVGSVDRRAFVTEKENGWLFSGRCLRVRTNSENADSKFLSFYFGQESFKKYIRGIAVGATMPSINTKILSDIQINLPPIEEQKEIAKILSSLDDKIELNRRMNATLEAMAKALFKAWFVDFEPVRANMENRPSESASPEIAKLFPSEFENEIPKGWRIGTLNEISFNYRQNVNPNEVEAETPYVGLEHIPKKSIALTEWGNSEKAESTKSSFKSNDILFGKLRPYFHKVVIAPFDGICSTDILVIRPKNNYHFGQILITYSSDEIIQYADRLSNGAKMPRTNWSDLAKFEVVIPTKQISEEFSKFMTSIAEKIKLNICENQKLAEIRDSLLPRLISGKIRCSE